jgi:hypothetical protein
MKRRTFLTKCKHFHVSLVWLSQYYFRLSVATPSKFARGRKPNGLTSAIFKQSGRLYRDGKFVYNLPQHNSQLSSLCLNIFWSLTRKQSFVHLHKLGIWGDSEPAPTSAPWRMDGKWSGNSFLLGSSSLANHDSLAHLLLFYNLPTNNQQSRLLVGT